MTLFESIHAAATEGRQAAISPELARALLQASPDEVAAILGLDRASRVRRRNAALQRAAQALSADGCGPWLAAGRLAKAIRHFERFRWPALLSGAQLELDEAEQALHDAFATGATALTCQRRLFELLRSD